MLRKFLSQILTPDYAAVTSDYHMTELGCFGMRGGRETHRAPHTEQRKHLKQSTFFHLLCITFLLCLQFIYLSWTHMSYRKHKGKMLFLPDTSTSNS